MAFQFTCPNPECHHAGKAPDVYQGRFVRCKRCGHKFRLGSPAGSESCGAAPANPGKSEPLLSETGEYVPSMIETSVMDLEIPAPFPRQVGRFQLRARLGVGAFATVFRALDPQLDREVALKIPHPGLLDSARSRERFLREARVAGQLRHANIVTVYEAGSEQDTHYIATALIPGRTLGQIIEDDRPDFAQAARMVRDVAQALAYAHDLGVVHRDVKPSNIMVDDKGEVFLMDFGLAYRLDAAERVTFQGAILGTPAYMAPEQAGGNSGEAQPASDQYSLGAVLYKLLCGQPPFVGSSEAVLYNAIHQPPTAPRTLNAKVPHELEAICLRALAKRPEDRYPSCRDMAEDLDRWLENFPTRAGSPSLEA